MVLLRKILLPLFLLISLASYGQTTYYISPTGSDAAAGTEGDPWKTFYKATSTVTTSGDIIYVGSGTYNETTDSNLSLGVSIDGDGRNNVTIKATSGMTTMLTLFSSAGTDGDQYIRDVTFDGDSIATTGVVISGRSNVEFYNCTITQTIRYGVLFKDQNSRSVTTEPTNWATGNSFHDNNMIDCGRDSWSTYWSADAAIDISGQDGMLLYNNDIDNQTGGRYAYGLKALYSGGYLKGVKIYDNKIRTNIRDNVGEQAFGFNIEIWTGVGGIEIYGNDLNGCIDMGGYGYWDDYSYGFAFDVHDNTLIQDSRPTYDGEAGLILESGGEDGMYFRKNWVENFSTGMTFGCTAASLVQGFDSVVVSYNVFANIGYTSGGVGAGVSGYNLSTGVTINKFYVLNNVFHKVNNASGWGLNFEYSTENTWTNIAIKNNVIYNAYNPVQFNNQTINGIGVDNNVIYGQTSGTIPNYTDSDVSNNTYNDNQVSTNPLFTSVGTDFSLQSTSPCIDAGVDVDLTTDYAGEDVPSGTLPDIGAYEYQQEEEPEEPATTTGFGKISSTKFGKSASGKFVKL
jgi:hypothetical protein